MFHANLPEYPSAVIINLGVPTLLRGAGAMKVKFYEFTILIEQEEEGEGYYAYSPDLPGCYSNGSTIEETRRNVREAIQLHIETLLENQEVVPQSGKLVVAELLSIGIPA
jgi:predicted RNase H-like HicB family nuclease